MEPADGELRPHVDVVHRQLDDATVLVHLRTNRIYTLNATGGRFWELMAAGHHRPEIRSRLLEEFDVPEVELDREIERLVSELVSEGLATRDAA